MNPVILTLLVANPAPIERVVVFSDRAEVTRTVEAACSGDKVEVEFPMLPVALDLRTLRAEAGGKAKAMGVVSEVGPVEADRDVRRAELQKALDKVQVRLQEVRDALVGEQERVNDSHHYSELLSAVLGEELRSPKPNPDAWKRALALLEATETDARLKSVGSLAELRKLEREEAQLYRRLSAFDGTAPKEARQAKVAVACQGEGRTVVRLSYVVPGATWHPEYDLRFVTEGSSKVGRGKVELTVGAVIQQATGEDWLKAKIVLSTSKPKLGAEAPEPAPIMVNGYKSSEGQVLVQGTEDRSSLQVGSAAGGGGPQAVTLDDGGKSITLTLPTAIDVFSDGRPYWVPVDEASGNGESFLLTIPKLSPYVYQALKANNPASYPLMEGRVHVYRNGSYVGDTSTKYLGAGEPMELSLGLDEELAVERIDVKTLDRKPGVFSSKIKMERELAIKVTNRAKNAERIEVREQIPVSKDERIAVELGDKTSKGVKVDAERGIVSWVVELSKGQSKRLELSYVILLPESWKM
jgi:uncharacterized protein (TIGR02231 family)